MSVHQEGDKRGASIFSSLFVGFVFGLGNKLENLGAVESSASIDVRVIVSVGTGEIYNEGVRSEADTEVWAFAWGGAR